MDLNGPVALRHVGVAAWCRSGTASSSNGQGGGEDDVASRDPVSQLYKMK